MSDSKEYLQILDSTLSVFDMIDTKEDEIFDELMGTAALSVHRQTAIRALVKSHGLGTVEFLIKTMLIEPHDAITYHEILSELLESELSPFRRFRMSIPTLDKLGYNQERILEFWSDWWLKNASKREYSTLKWAKHSLRLRLALTAYEVRRIDEMEPFVENDDPVVRLALTRNSSITSEVRQRLAHDPETIVRVTLAQDEKTDLATLRILADDSNTMVRRWVANHPKLDRSLYEKLKADESKDVISFLANNSRCPRDVLEDLARSEIVEVAEKAKNQLASGTCPSAIADAGSSIGRLISSADSPAPPTEEIEAICSAANRGDVKRVEELLVQNPRLAGATDSSGKTPLHQAAALPHTEGHFEIVKMLIARGADVNAKDSEGATPLHWVACRPQLFGLQIAETLIQHGASPDAKDNGGHTPRDTALRWSSVYGYQMLELMDHG